MVIKQFKGKLPRIPPKTYLNGTGLTLGPWNSLERVTTPGRMLLENLQCIEYLLSPGHSAGLDVKVGDNVHSVSEVSVSSPCIAEKIGPGSV